MVGPNPTLLIGDPNFALHIRLRHGGDEASDIQSSLERKERRTTRKTMLKSQGVLGCEGPACPNDQDCQRSDWSGWGACSATCGPGAKERVREIKKAPREAGIMCESKTTVELAR